MLLRGLGLTLIVYAGPALRESSNFDLLIRQEDKAATKVSLEQTRVQ
jgi:hypothetical protein